MSSSHRGSEVCVKSMARRNVTEVIIGDLEVALESLERMIGELYLVVAVRIAYCMCWM